MSSAGAGLRLALSPAEGADADAKPDAEHLSLSGAPSLTESCADEPGVGADRRSIALWMPFTSLPPPPPEVMLGMAGALPATD